MSPMEEIASEAKQPPGPVSILIAGGCRVASGSSQHSFLDIQQSPFIDTRVHGAGNLWDGFNGLFGEGHVQTCPLPRERFPQAEGGPGCGSDQVPSVQGW